MTTTQPLIVTKEKYLITNNWTACGESELVQAKLAFSFCFKIIRRVEDIVTEKLPRSAVETVGAGFDGGIQNRCAGTTIFCTESSGLDFEFLNRIHRRKNDEICTVQEIHGVGVVINTVEQVVVLGRAQSVRDKRTSGGITSGIRLRGVYTRAKLRQESEVAPVQRQIVHVFLINHLSYRRGLGFK